MCHRKKHRLDINKGSYIELKKFDWLPSKTAQDHQVTQSQILGTPENADP